MRRWQSVANRKAKGLADDRRLTTDDQRLPFQLLIVFDSSSQVTALLRKYDWFAM